MLRKAFLVYVAISVLLIGVSLYTGRAATLRAGVPHYLLTRTNIYVKQEVPAENATDAAFDDAFNESGESTEMTVESPQFVLGLLDATAPFVVVGGLALGVASLIKRRKRRGSIGNPEAPNV